MANKYQYLFPFEKVPKGSNVFIYGAGDVGFEYLQQILVSDYCHCIGFLDRSWDKLPKLVVPIYEPSYVKEIEADYIVLALKTGVHVRAIRENLNKYGINDEKIIYQENRSDVIILAEENSCKNINQKFAFQNNTISIALKFGPGLGDCIVKKRQYLELVKMVGDCQVDIYTPNSKIVNSIFGNHRNLNQIIMDSGSMYEAYKSKYDVAIKLFFNVELDVVNEKELDNKNKPFADKMRKLKEKLKEYNLPIFPVQNMNIHFQRMKYLGYNYYNYLNYTGVFDIQDQHVDIPLALNYKKAFEKMCLDQFITINYGTAVALKNSLDSTAKQWPYNNFCEFVKLFKEKYPEIEVVQLGVKDAAKVESVDRYILGESLELVKYVLKNSLVHIDSEGGLVHLATNLGTKCVVMFGPTPEWFFGYKENINIVSEVCSGCHCLYDGFDVCAKGISPAPCMDSISPDRILNEVRKCFNRYESLLNLYKINSDNIELASAPFNSLLIKYNEIIPNNISNFIQFPLLAQATIIHEYVHYIQTLMYNSGLDEYCFYMEFMLDGLDYMKKIGKDSVQVPLNLYEIYEKGAALYDKEFWDNVYDLRKGIICDVVDMILEITDVSIEYDNGLLDEMYNPDSTYSYEQYKYMMSSVLLQYNGNKTINFGTYCIKESMAYMIERELFGKAMTMPDYPYNICEILCKKIYEEFAEETWRIVALCEVALCSDNPPALFYSLLKKIKGDRFIPDNTNDFNKFVNDECIGQARLLSIYRKRLCRFRGILQRLYDFPHKDEQFSDCMKFMNMEIYLMMRRRSESLTPLAEIICLPKNDRINEFNQFMSYFHHPIVIDKNHEIYNHPKNDFLYLLSISYVLYLLIIEKSDKTEGRFKCFLYDVCKKSQHICFDECICVSKPWEQSKKSKPCILGFYWSRFGLSDIELKVKNI